MSKKNDKPFYKKTWFIIVSVIVVLAIIGALSGEETLNEANDNLPTNQNTSLTEKTSEITNIPIQYISLGTVKKDRWTADAGISGIILNVHFFSLPEEYIQSKGNMIVSLYMAGVTQFGEPVNIRGDLQESWEKEYDVDDFVIGTCGDKKCGFLEDIRLEYTKEHDLKRLNAAGILEVKFVDEEGNEFYAERIVQ